MPGDTPSSSARLIVEKFMSVAENGPGSLAHVRLYIYLTFSLLFVSPCVKFHAEIISNFSCCGMSLLRLFTGEYFSRCSIKFKNLWTHTIFPLASLKYFSSEINAVNISQINITHVYILLSLSCILIYRVSQKSRNGRIFHKLCTLKRNVSDKSCMA